MVVEKIPFEILGGSLECADALGYHRTQLGLCPPHLPL